MATLEVSNLTKNFGPTNVLRQINLSVEDGEFVVLLGPSGSGKSTLLAHAAAALTQGGAFLDEPTVGLDVLNALNSGAVTHVQELRFGLTNYLEPEAIVPPRRARFGFRFLTECFPQRATTIARQGLKRLGLG